MSHGGAIPDDEYWIKLGGDKGRGSFKFNIQVVNAVHPNSIKNTALLSVFMADDSTINLHTALDMYREHVKEVQGMRVGLVCKRFTRVPISTTITCSSRKVRLFLAGDYEFLCKLYGLSGASGMHNIENELHTQYFTHTRSPQLPAL